MRFSAPISPPVPSPVPINDGSYAPICPQASPLWSNVTTYWFTNGIDKINQTEGYQPPAVKAMPKQVTGISEDCLFLDMLVPQDIFEKRGMRKAAPVYVNSGGRRKGKR